MSGLKKQEVAKDGWYNRPWNLLVQVRSNTSRRRRLLGFFHHSIAGTNLTHEEPKWCSAICHLCRRPMCVQQQAHSETNRWGTAPNWKNMGEQNDNCFNLIFQILKSTFLHYSFLQIQPSEYFSNNYWLCISVSIYITMCCEWHQKAHVVYGCSAYVFQSFGNCK